MTAGDLPDALKAFTETFDFGEYEAAAYVAILEHGDLTAAELADYTEIPQPRVYDTVRRLADNGLVELQETRPMRVLAVDPRDAFEEIQTSLDRLIDDLEARYSEPARQSEAVSLITSPPTIFRHIEEIIDTAEYEIAASLSPALLDHFTDNLAAQKTEGVTSELVIAPAANTPGTDAFDYPSVADSVKIRRGVTTPVIVIADGLYALYATQEALAGAADRYGVVFNRSELGFLVSEFFNTVLWPSSEPLFDADADVSFPRRYGSIRRCIRDVQHSDATLYAAIVGREVDTGYRCVISGQVIGASFSDGVTGESLRLETEDRGSVTVGGQLSAAHDVAAHQISVDQNEAPSL